MDKFYFVYCVISFLCIVFGVFAIIALIKTNTLRKSRFKSLVFLLSISDIAIGVLIIIHAVVANLNTNTNGYMYGCMILKHLLSGTYGFSDFQVLVICMERLNSTFTTDVKFIRKLTCNVTVGIAFVSSQVYSLICFSIMLYIRPYPCDIWYLTNTIFVATNDIPHVFLMCASVGLYIAVIIRLLQQHYQISSSIAGYRPNNCIRKRLRRNMATLGMIVMVTILSILPREIVVLYSSFGKRVEFVSMAVSSGLILLIPVVNPLIYVLRFKEVRNLLMCRCNPNAVVTINVLPVPHDPV